MALGHRCQGVGCSAVTERLGIDAEPNGDEEVDGEEGGENAFLCESCFIHSITLTTSAQLRKACGGNSACSTSNPMAIMHNESMMTARMQLIHMNAAKWDLLISRGFP